MRRLTLQVVLVAVVAVHFALVIGNIAAFFVLPFYTDWYVAVPLGTFVATISISKHWRCPLTDAENDLRKALGMKPIGGFIGHYVVRRFRKSRRPSVLA